MARQASSQATNTYNQSQGLEGQGAGVSNESLNTLFPSYSKMAAGDATPGTTAANTAAQQSAGGATAGLVGQGESAAARTGNTGGYTAGLDKAARTSGKDLSTEAAGIKSNEVKQGLGGLQGLYSSGVGQQEAGLGDEDQATTTGINAGKSGWFQNLLGGLSAVNGK